MADNTTNTRKCSVCLEEKELTNFSKDKTRPLGIRYICRICHKIKDTKYRARRRHNSAEWRKNNPDKLKLQYTARYKNNPTKGRIERLMRAKRTKQATPTWANKNYIKLFYTLAQEESQRLGYKVSVDHIIPLKHPLVCGLHNEFNLQLMSFSDNCKKHNSFNIGV